MVLILDKPIVCNKEKNDFEKDVAENISGTNYQNFSHIKTNIFCSCTVKKNIFQISAKF